MANPKTNVLIDPSLKAAAKAYCKENGMLFYKVIELALIDYLKSKGVKIHG